MNLRKLHGKIISNLSQPRRTVRIASLQIPVKHFTALTSM